ncbi:hypothetical protein F1D05_36620 [Kribbella qitaiheensis]|uniref:Uncharacterized protein n=1 Tax=Kribbella qitaiheensis TaxID=1544730 RepID=A0A7G6X852_9ACTN|nr:hypothetical protein [Kribbella qitaiheensis]QNE22417.1 hypothetical protein F1D05_36620 [Kribbella qitaiheensis]
MSDLASEAAKILVPLAAMGAGAVVQEAAKETGKDLHSLGSRILERMRKRLPRPAPDVDEMADALRVGVIDQVLTEDELRHLVQLATGRRSEGGVTIHGPVVARNAPIGNTFEGPVNFS